MVIMTTLEANVRELADQFDAMALKTQRERCVGLVAALRMVDDLNVDSLLRVLQDTSRLEARQEAFEEMATALRGLLTKEEVLV